MTKADKKLGIVKPKHKPLVHDAPIHGKRKPKKDKRKWEDKYYICPFCACTLNKIDPTQGRYIFKSVPGAGYGTMENNTEKACNNCGAFEIKAACPSCHRDVWFKPDGDDKTCSKGEYKHYKHGCGFASRIKNVKE